MRVHRPGISLIEIIIAITLVGLMAIIIVPQFSRRIPPHQQMLNNINMLLRVAQNNALLTGKVHRLLFDLKASTIILQQEEGENFVPVSLGYTPSTTAWNPEYHLIQFMVQGKDELIQGAGVATSQVWLFIMPDGTAQDATIGIRNEETGDRMTFILSPFNAQMRLV